MPFLIVGGVLLLLFYLFGVSFLVVAGAVLGGLLLWLLGAFADGNDDYGGGFVICVLVVGGFLLWWFG